MRPTAAAGIRLRPTYWLWDGRMPQGAVTIGPGREGIGKSLFCAWLAAHVTLGELPGVHYGQPRSVIYAATEDSWERTLAGRLLVAGADLNRVFKVEVEQVGHHVALSLPQDCDSMAAAITANDVALLIADPLISVVDAKINPNQDAELRRALEPLARLADTTGCAVFGLAHFNKATGTDVLSRVTGSRAFAAVARAAVAFARDTTADDGTCVISQAKNNLGRLDLPSLRYHVEEVEVATDEGPAKWGRLAMLGETTTHVDDLLDDGPGDREGRRETEEAAAWLEDYLTSQGGTAASAAAKKAGKAAGLTERTLQRAAREQLRVAEKSEGFPRRTFWSLP